jgi:hypothetical protein
MEKEIPEQQPLEIVQQKDQENLQPPKKGIIPWGEQRFLPQQAEESQLHHHLKRDGVAITKRTRGLGEVSDTNADDELSFMVDQLKEIALKVRGRKCVVIAQITELQKKNDTLAK